MARMRSALIEFDRRTSRLAGGKHLRDGLSAAAVAGDTLWVVNDETLNVERLQRIVARPLTYGAHRSYALGDFLALHRAPRHVEPDDPRFSEGDIEGLDVRSGYLWLLGSHSLRRGAPKTGDVPGRMQRLARMEKDGNQFLLARIPLADEDGVPTLARSTGRGRNARRAAQLPGDDSSNLLTEALADDEHLWPFLAIPGQENGLDIEGLAVAEGERVFLGLRGPVLRGYAVVLELLLEAERRDPSRLALKPIAAQGPRGKRRAYRKHLLALDGLGIRDMRVHGADLLLLAGPTMDLNGPFRLYRWRGGARQKADQIVPSERLEPVLDLPSRPDGDHAEGLALLPGRAGRDELLVVYERTSRARKRGTDGVTADVFTLRR